MFPFHSIKNFFSIANLQKLYVSGPRVAKICHTQAAKKKLEFSQFLELVLLMNLNVTVI